MKYIKASYRQGRGLALAGILALGVSTLHAQSTNTNTMNRPSGTTGQPTTGTTRSSDRSTSASMNANTSGTGSMSMLMQPMQRMLSQMQAAPKTGNPDMDFATLTKIHHQGEIDLAQQQINSGSDQRLKTMAMMQMEQKQNEIAALDRMMRDLKSTPTDQAFMQKSKQKLDQMARMMSDGSMMSHSAGNSGMNNSTGGTMNSTAGNNQSNAGGNMTTSGNHNNSTGVNTTGTAGSSTGTTSGATMDNRSGDMNTSGSMGNGSGSGTMSGTAASMNNMNAMGFDRDFAAVMIKHHQDGIDMAQMYLQHGKDPKLRSFAELMVANAQDEIKLMQQLSGR